MDYSVFMAAAKVFAACFAVALLAWCLSRWGGLIALIIWHSERLTKSVDFIVDRLAVGFGLHRGRHLDGSDHQLVTFARQIIDIAVEWRLLLLSWIALVTWGFVTEPGLLPDAFVATAYGLIAVSLLIVVSLSSTATEWVAVWTLVALTAIIWWAILLSDAEAIRTLSDLLKFYLALLLATLVVAFLAVRRSNSYVWYVLHALTLPVALAAAFFNDVPRALFIQSAHWISMLIGMLLVFSAAVFWRLSREEQVKHIPEGGRRVTVHPAPFHQLGFTFEFCLMLGYAGFVAIYLLHMIDRDCGLIIASNADKASIYILFLWNEIVEQIPFVGNLFERAVSALGLPPLSGNVGAWTEQFFAESVRWFLNLLAILAGLSGIAIAVRSMSRRSATNFGAKVRESLEEKKLNVVPDLVIKASAGGRAYLHVSTQEADRAILRRRVPAEFDKWDQVQLQGLMPPLFGYFVSVTSGSGFVRRRFLRQGSCAVRDFLNLRTRRYWPGLQNHLAVSSSIHIADIVKILRASASEWSADRAPANFAATMNLLGIELSRLVAQQWDDESADLGELSDILDEAATFLRRAISIFGNLLPPIDAAAVSHNLGVIELMLGRLKHDPVQAQSAVRNLLRALSERDGDAQYGMAAGALEIDAAASHLYVALSYGLLARINLDDAHTVEILQHCSRSIALYQKNAGLVVSARENLIVACIHSANLAMQLGHWNLALKYLFQAKRHLELPELNRATTDYRFGIFVRYALAAIRLAQEEMEHLQESGGNAKERVRRSLKRGQTAIAGIAKAASLETRVRIANRANGKEALRDLRTLYLLAGYYVWVRTESELSFAGREFDLLPPMNSIAELLQSGLDWDPALPEEVGKGDEQAEKTAVARTAKELADHIAGVIGSSE